MNALYPLSDELAIKAANGGGLILYQNCAPYPPIATLSAGEMTELLRWWYLQHVQAPPDSDYVALVVELAGSRQIEPQTAVIALRALMAQAVEAALAGWAMSEDPDEQGGEGVER